jgi:ATP-independent RNA helicase DbpA
MKIGEKFIEEILEKLGFDALNEIQKKMLKEGIGSDQVILFSPTGTGKTISYLLVLLNSLKKENQGVQSMIIVPSRELAIQIEQVFRSMSTGLKVNSCYGGHSIKTELNNFKEPPAVVIGTPGRIADHLRRESFQPDSVTSIVLDEFDKTLEMGFDKEMQFIFQKMERIRKIILTTATKNLEIPSYTGINNPLIIDFLQGYAQPQLKIMAIRSEENDKLETLKKLICYIGREPSLIFCNHRDAVERISYLLQHDGIAHDIFHGGLEQIERERALIKFRNGSLMFLIVTDLASRGLDIPEIRNIIHYQLPSKKEVFIHRNGRTARMNRSGKIWLILSQTEGLPDYMEEDIEITNLHEKKNLPDPPDWITLYIGGGKKEKISRKDIVGFLIQAGELTKEEIGLISIQDNSSFAAIKREKAFHLPKKIKDFKIKGKKVKIAISD